MKQLSQQINEALLGGKNLRHTKNTEKKEDVKTFRKLKKGDNIYYYSVTRGSAYKYIILDIDGDSFDVHKVEEFSNFKTDFIRNAQPIDTTGHIQRETFDSNIYRKFVKLGNFEFFISTDLDVLHRTILNPGLWENIKTVNR